MKIEEFPEDIKARLVPEPTGDLVYECLSCGAFHGIENLLYTCPSCGGVLLLVDRDFDRLKQTPPEVWRRIFDHRRMLNLPALSGIYRYHEFIGPVVPLSSVVYLGEGHTPMVEAGPELTRLGFLDAREQFGDLLGFIGFGRRRDRV